MAGLVISWEHQATVGGFLANSSDSFTIWCDFVAFLPRLQLWVYCDSPADCQLTLVTKECCHVSHIYCGFS